MLFNVHIYSYLIEDEVCYLVLCKKNYNKRLAYSYLEDIAQEFHSRYGKRVNTVTRPYSFIEFGMYRSTAVYINFNYYLTPRYLYLLFLSDTYIQKAKAAFLDGRSRRNMNTLNTQLQDVQRIMVQNIDDVLQRGTILSGNDTMNI